MFLIDKKTYILPSSPRVPPSPPFTELQVWMCGGSMEVLPCSRVAHIARTKKPYHNNIAFHTRRNALRVAEVWMDEYKSNVYLAWNIPMEVRGGREGGYNAPYSWSLSTLYAKKSAAIHCTIYCLSYFALCMCCSVPIIESLPDNYILVLKCNKPDYLYFNIVMTSF